MTTATAAKAIKDNIDTSAETPLAEQAQAVAEDTIARAQESVAAAVDQGVEQYDRFAAQSAKFVRENPGVAVAGAIGLGVLIGLSMRNRH